VGSFQETIARGAFRRTLSENPDVSLLVNHAGTPLARTASGTLTLLEDIHGLFFRAELEPSDPDVQSIVPKLRRGDLSECSFAFRATAQTWSEDKTERAIRACDINRGDVSLVTTAANPAATASLRAERLTLEQREQIAEQVGERVCGPYSTLSASVVPRSASRRRRSTPDHVLLVARARTGVYRARLARLSRAQLAPHSPPRRYSSAEVQALGKAGKAFKKVNGVYAWPIVDEEDLRNAIHAIGRAPKSEVLAVKRWILFSAERVGRKGMVPSGWWDEVAAKSPHGLPR
jgi:HK97 family phage prohead protease